MDLPPLPLLFNLQFEGLDPFFPLIPRFAKEPNQWFFDCQLFTIKTICMFACFIGFQTAFNTINKYRRSRADEYKSEEFFFKYNVENHDIIKDETYHQALALVTHWFRPKNLIHPVHFTDLRWYPWKLSTNAERPFSTDTTIKTKLKIAKEWNLIDNARMSFHNCYQEIFRFSRTYIHKIKDGIPVKLYPITLHIKPALVTDDDPDKVRTVFGVPKMLIFAEAMFFWPLFSSYFIEENTPLLWNYETLNGGWYRLNQEWHDKFSSFRPVFNLDWKEFDMRVYFSMWSDCIDQVSSYFCFCGNYCPTGTYPHPRTDPNRIINLWKWLKTAYFQSPCVTTLGRTFTRKFAGMPSGIFCTQFWDSFYNAVMVITILLALKQPVSNDHFIKLMGDDVLFGLLSNMPIDQWNSFLDAFQFEAHRRFGSKLSITKCGVSPTIHGAEVLSYKNWNGYPTRSAEQLLAQLLHPKSLRDTYPRLMARAIGIYYASAGNPKLRPICEHIYSELKFKGFEPHAQTLQKLFDPQFIEQVQIPLDHFPSQTEVISRLASPSKRNVTIQSQYWNREHFYLLPGCSWNCPVQPT
jgi:hypothetical protein